MFEAFSIFGGIIGLLTLAIQVGCVIHVIRENKEIYWLAIIFFFPVFGSLVYFFVEVAPSMRNNRHVRSLGNSKKASKGTIRKLKELVQQSDTVENNLKLADALLSRNEFSEAVAIYEECLSGLYTNDPVILHRLSEAYLGMKDYDKSLRLLQKIDSLDYRDYKIDRQFQMVLCLKGLQQRERAIAILRQIVGAHPGEEARYTLGLLLMEENDFASASKVFAEVIANRNRYKKAAVGSQRKWVSLARKGLKEIKDYEAAESATGGIRS